MSFLIQTAVALGLVAFCAVGLGAALGRRARRHGKCSCTGSGQDCACATPTPTNPGDR